MTAGPTPGARGLERAVGKGRPHAWGGRCLATLLCLGLQTAPLFGFGSTNSAAEAIPQLRPAKAEIPATFWEEHGLVTVVGGVLSLLLLAVVVWLLTRPKPVAPPPPEAVARRALESLRARPEDDVVLSRVSRILRQYLVALFDLSRDQMTTTEFCGVLRAHPRIGSELAGLATEFLRRCDERKFAPKAPAEALRAVDAALNLIVIAERRGAGEPEPGRGAPGEEHRSKS